MARSTSSAILAIFFGSTLATLPGCNTNKVTNGQSGGKTSDAAPGGGGVTNTGGANASDGNAKTGGATGAGGAGGVVGIGGANASGGVIGWLWFRRRFQSRRRVRPRLDDVLRSVP